MAKKFKKLGIVQNYLNIIKTTYEKTTGGILHVKKNFQKKFQNKLIKISEYKANIKSQFNFDTLIINNTKTLRK